jgi:hypothetical protein
MGKKIEDKYGAQAKNCADAIEKGDLKKAAKCIDDISDLSFEQILKDLTSWSLKCAFEFNEEIIEYLKQDNIEKKAQIADDSTP